MPCRSPRPQYWLPNGEWTLDPNRAASVRIKRDLPCGVCPDCRIRRTREWSIRCYHESQLHSGSSFVNPTYADNPVTLSRKDPRVFIRALRDRGLKFQYFGCGEYGEKLGRPHYHIILFGQDFRRDRYPWKRINGNLYYRSPTLEKAWPHGLILLSDFDVKNALYTAGYTMKKIGGKLKDEIDPETGLKHYEKIDEETGQIIELEPEFTMASTKPAIGKRWLEKNYKELYVTDSVVMNGKEYQIPRKYDEWLKKIDPKLHEEVMLKRADYLVNAPRQTDEQRAMAAAARDNKRKHFVPERK